MLDAERTRRRRSSPTPSATSPRSRYVERHHATGRIGLGLVTGLRLAPRRRRDDRRARRAQHRRGRHGRRRPRRAASSVLAEIGGGIVIYEDGELRGELPLPVAGLMSDEPAAAVVASLDHLHAVVRELGLDARGAVHDAQLPGALGDPGAQDHRPGPGRRRTVRPRPVRRLTTRPIGRGCAAGSRRHSPARAAVPRGPCASAAACGARELLPWARRR